MIHVVRHAHAGSRAEWDGPDHERPLSPRGHEQAAAIADHLAGAGIERILTSPYVRCVQSVEPLAARLGIVVEHERVLAEETPGHLVDAFFDEVGPGTVLCSHGDIISGLIGRLAAEGADLDGGLAWKKASVWHLEPGVNGRATTGSYQPPPATSG